MNYLFSIVCLLISLSVNAQMTSIPDVNFESTLIVQGYDTLPLDGQVPTANISSITVLDVSSKNIADLTGIEDFTALANLDIGNNVLTSLDLSNNSQLVGLWCLYNPFTCVNLQNGNNANMVLFHAYQCPNLVCVQVDDAIYSDTTWISGSGSPLVTYQFDTTINFSEYCEDCNVGLSEFSQQKLTIYPNPTSDHIQIDGLTINSAVSIYDISGQLVLMAQGINETDILDLSKIENGMLFIKVESNGQVFWDHLLKH